MCRAPSMAPMPSMATTPSIWPPLVDAAHHATPNGRSAAADGCSSALLLLAAYPHCFRLCLSFSVACLTSSTALVFAFSVSSYSSLSFLALA